jgi:hypothetical protein
MNKKIYLLFIAFLFSASMYAQDNQNAKQDSINLAIAEGKKPVDEQWGCTMLIDAETSLIPAKGSLELHIQHRFSNLSNGIHDLFGLYGASNIRMALQYSILDQLSVGFATEKDNKYQEFFAKGKLLEQNVSGSIPLSLTLYGNATISGRPKDYYGVDSTYQFKDRMSYFAQLIVARKFCKAFSMELGASYSHTNKVESVKFTDTTNTEIVTSYKPLYENGIFGITAGARINFYNYHSFLLEYDQGFFTKIGENQMPFPKPNVAFAYELATPTHCFQVFVSSYRALNPQHNFTKNQFDFTKKLGLMLGFNITVRLR